MEILVEQFVVLKVDRALRRAGCPEDTSSGEDDHLGLHPYYACQGKQHELGRMPGLGKKLG
jgi:hypothetical protein